jgi:hypothetical protein
VRLNLDEDLIKIVAAMQQTRKIRLPRLISLSFPYQFQRFVGHQFPPGRLCHEGRGVRVHHF